MKINIAIGLFFISLFSFAQEKDKEIKVWSLEDCIAYAKEKSITVQTTGLTLKAAEVNYEKSKALRLPDLTGSFSQSLSNGNTIDPITSVYVVQQVHSTSPGLSTSVTLFQGNQISNQIKQNKLLVEQNSLYVEEAKNSVALSITEAYLRALYNKEGISIAQNNVISSEKEVARAKARLDAGSIAMKDYTDAVSQAATNKYSLIDAKNSYAQQIIILKQLLELSPEDAFEIVTPEAENIIVGLIPDKMEVYNHALNNLPEIKASLINKSVSEKDLDIAKGGFLPTLSLSGSMGSGYTSTQDFDFLDQMSLNFNQRVGLSLSVPIFDRNQTKSQVQTAKINIQKAELESQTTRKELYKKVETSWQNATASEEQLAASKVARDAASESYKLAQKKYELNDLSTTDLVVSQNTYTNAQQNYIQAKYLNILYYQLLQFYQGNEIKL
ncbi:Outer membrane efflux protein BepC precursor [compost metagenome]